MGLLAKVTKRLFGRRFRGVALAPLSRRLRRGGELTKRLRAVREREMLAMLRKGMK